MSSVVGAERKGKRLARLEDIISKLSISASQSCVKFLPELKLIYLITKILRKCL